MAGDAVFIGSCSGNLYCLDRFTGKVKWAYDIRQDGNQSEFHGNPVVTEDLLIIPTDGRQEDGIGHVYAFDRLSGKVVWKYRFRYGVSTDLLLVGNRIYGASLNDDFFCLDTSGKLLWSYSTGEQNPEFRLPSSPVQWEDRIFFSGVKSTVYALQSQTGKVQWIKELPAERSTQLVGHENRIYVGGRNNHVYSLDVTKGDIRDDIELSATPSWKPIILNDSILMLLTSSHDDCCSELVSLDLSSHKIQWSLKPPEGDLWDLPRLLVSNDTLFAGTNQGTLMQVRLSNGAPVSSFKIEGDIRSLCYYEGILYAGVSRGSVYAILPQP